MLELIIHFVHILPCVGLRDLRNISDNIFDCFENHATLHSARHYHYMVISPHLASIIVISQIGIFSGLNSFSMVTLE